MDAELTVRFADTSLDPYVRFFEPRLSPFTNAVAGGTIRVVGELADVDHLVVETHVESLDLKLFDYRLKNKGTIDLSLDHHVLKVDQLRLTGEGTELQVQGQVAFDRNEISVQASGDGNLGILQGFYRDLRSRGTAAIKAQISGPLDKPVFSGSADVTDGRIRVLSVPNSIEAINGRLSFDADGVRLDDVAARLGEGDVRFGGRIGITGFTLGDLNLTATGERMRIRYPAGFVSTIDANLALQGTIAAPVLSGNVLVRDALWSRRIEATPGFFNLTGGGSAAPAVAAPASSIPLRLDIDIDAPSSFRIENNIAKMIASADLKLQGTYDRPAIVRSRGDRSRGHRLRGKSIRGDARRRGLLQCVAHRAGLRHRGRDPRARARADLQHHAWVQRHDEPILVLAELRSSAAAGGHSLGAAWSADRPHQRGASRLEARAQRSSRRKCSCGRRSHACSRAPSRRLSAGFSARRSASRP